MTSTILTVCQFFLGVAVTAFFGNLGLFIPELSALTMFFFVACLFICSWLFMREEMHDGTILFGAILLGGIIVWLI